MPGQGTEIQSLHASLSRRMQQCLKQPHAPGHRKVPPATMARLHVGCLPDVGQLGGQLLDGGVVWHQLRQRRAWQGADSWDCPRGSLLQCISTGKWHQMPSDAPRAQSHGLDAPIPLPPGPAALPYSPIPSPSHTHLGHHKVQQRGLAVGALDVGQLEQRVQLEPSGVGIARALHRGA